MSLFQMLLSAKGRIRRRDYWLYSIGTGLMFLVLQYTAFAFTVSGGNFLTRLQQIQAGHFDNFAYIYYALVLIVWWPQTCINAKRWHDRNRSGYLAGLFMVAYVFYYGLILVKANYHASNILNAAQVMASVVYYALAIWNFIECGCLDGTKGPNKYGPSPKGIGAAPDVF